MAGGKPAPANQKKAGPGVTKTAGDAAKGVSGTAKGVAKDASETANGAVGNLAQTGKTTVGAIKRGDIKGVGSGLAKGTGATVGAAGQGVSFFIPSRVSLADGMSRLERLYQGLERVSTPQCEFLDSKVMREYF